jgi:hypothetical protein
MRLSAGAWRWLIVPTTQSRSDWRGEKRGASAPKRHIEARARHGHVLHGAARRDEGVLKERVLLRPVQQVLDARGREAGERSLEDARGRAFHFSHSRAPFFQT